MLRLLLEHVRAIRRVNVQTVLPSSLEGLATLAGNLRWCWDDVTLNLFSEIDPQLFREVGDDPVQLLADVAASRLEELAQNPDYVNRVHMAVTGLNEYLSRSAWYQTLDSSAPKAIAYFSAEFGVATQLPQYSGGLGILAGDHLKAASDLGVPIVGIGLFYRAGYFRQSLSAEGWQEEQYPVTDPNALPLSLLRESDGTPARISIGLPGGNRLLAHVWVAQVGRVPLLLLDSNVEDNAPAQRDVTDRLYGGGHEHRLLQEVLLGIGGVRAIRTFSRITGFATPEVYHCNEGHAGFLALERILEHVGAGLDFDTALEVVRAGTVFTTHTPVPAGIDRFDKSLIEQFFGGDNEADEVPLQRILALGTEDFVGGESHIFNMAVFGLRLAARANGVSLLHGEVSRDMFNALWSGFDTHEVPITSITNGVHAGTWVAPEILKLAGDASVDEPVGWERIAGVNDNDFWTIKRTLRERLVMNARDRLKKSWLKRGATEAELDWINDVLDPNILTIGFARRVPSYKRLTLMLSDPVRLKSLLLHPTRPIQLVIAGKSHPADEGGKKLIQELVRFADDPEVRHRIVFLPDYDMGMASWMYPGCDVWLNNPLRPLEACGTSGMKAALNGALNLSILDGWWDEWYDSKNGWAIPTADGVLDQDRRDDLEANALYNLIEKNVTPIFYDQTNGLPLRWLELVKHTLATLGPKVLASRMVQDYVNLLYRPTAVSARQFNADNARLARELAVWKRRIRSAWSSVHVEHIEMIDLKPVAQQGDKVEVHAYISLGSLTPQDVAVELIYGRADANDRIINPVRVELSALSQFDGVRWRYVSEVVLETAGTVGYTVRVIPKHAGLTNAAELGLQSVAH